MQYIRKPNPISKNKPHLRAPDIAQTVEVYMKFMHN